MPMTQSGCTEALRGEILAEARRECEAIERRARDQAEALLAKAAREADTLHQERIARARAEAERRRESILATIPAEVGRMRAAHVEALLESIRAEVRRRLSAGQGFDSRRTATCLAAAAIGQMSGDAFLLNLQPADRTAFGSGLEGEVAALVGRSPLSLSVGEEAGMAEPGVMVEDVDGRQIWDNRLSARLERPWPQLRRQIATQASLLDVGLWR